MYLYFLFLILSLPSCTCLSTYYVPGNASTAAIAPLRPDIESFPSGTWVANGDKGELNMEEICWTQWWLVLWREVKQGRRETLPEVWPGRPPWEGSTWVEWESIYAEGMASVKVWRMGPVWCPGETAGWDGPTRGMLYVIFPLFPSTFTVF